MLLLLLSCNQLSSFQNVRLVFEVILPSLDVVTVSLESLKNKHQQTATCALFKVKYGTEIRNVKTTTLVSFFSGSRNAGKFLCKSIVITETA